MSDAVRFDLFTFSRYCGSASGVVGLRHISGVAPELCWLVAADLGTAALPAAGFLGVTWGGEFAVKLIFAHNAGQLLLLLCQFAGSSHPIFPS